MTRQMNQVFHCPNCKTVTASETAFSAWTRTRPELDSIKQGLAIIDIDYIIHKYKTYRGREFQCVMFVEVKTHGAAIPDWQADTLFTVNQVLRNRTNTPTKKSKKQCDGTIKTAYSLIAKRVMTLKVFGYHALVFSQLGPKDSEWMTWDKKIISEEQLIGLLNFDLDPDTLRPMDLRSHHRSADVDQLSFLAAVFEDGKTT